MLTVSLIAVARVRARRQILSEVTGPSLAVRRDAGSPEAVHPELVLLRAGRPLGESGYLSNEK
mgnify:CR=1 FL=1